MASTIGVEQWVPPGPVELTRHGREFGFTFVDDEEESVKQEYPTLPPIPPLIPIGEASECDGRYGGVIMVNSGEEDSKLLQLFGAAESDGEQAVPPKAEPEVCGLLQELVSVVADDSPATELDQKPGKVSRRRSASSGVSKKRRKRSTSCSTTSSTCSNASSHHRHRHRHRKHRHRHRKSPSPPPPIPRVNPIFVWIKQDDTRIVEVLCEDYDKRNRIRLTKTAQGWRAMPRTERFSSTSSNPLLPSPTATSPPSSSSRRNSSSSPTHRIATPQVSPQPADAPCDGATDDQNNVTSPVTGEVDHSMTEEERESEYAFDTKDHVTENEEDMVEEEEEEAEAAMEDEQQEEADACELPDEEQFYTEQDENLQYSQQEHEESDAAEDMAEEIQEDAMDMEEEDLEPTDLSIPKVRDNEDETFILPRKLPIVIPTPPPKTSPHLNNNNNNATPYPEAKPAHQQKSQAKSMFLESLLSTPRKGAQITRVPKEAHQGTPPLDLGISALRNSGSPTVSCSDENCSKPIVKSSAVEITETKAPCLKVEDITLKNLLNKQPETRKFPNGLDITIKPIERKEDSDSTRKSRLLELLTSEPASSSPASPAPPLDPLSQLKKVLMDPDISVPDPLLVPRDRLQELITSPGKEIPRLLTMRPELRLPEVLAYPALLRDPDILVVSLSHLQNLLQKPEKLGKEDDGISYSTLGAFLEWQGYQTQQQAAKELLDNQLKQQQQLASGDIDVSTAAALNQMLWIPYLNQLEAVAMASGNNQEFLNMLSAMFPNSYPSPGGHQPPNYPFLSMSPSFPLPTADYKSQLEIQQALALWQEVALQNNNNTSSRSGPKLGGNNTTGNKNNGRYSHISRKVNNSSARTSPISPNFHPNQQRSVSAAATTPQFPGGNGYSTNAQLQHQYNLQQRYRQSNNNMFSHKLPKNELNIDSALTSKNSSKPAVTCKSLLNLLSSRQQQQQRLQLPHDTTVKPTQHKSSKPYQQVPHLVPLDGTTVMDLSGKKSHPEEKAKLKVRQHLIDPAITPKLLKEEVVSSTHSPGCDDKLQGTSPHLWHPLFGSQKTTYNSPWRWTTVTVNGE